MKNNTDAEIIADSSLVACCGLYCGACRSFLKGKCKGCKNYEKATWCKVRQCCQTNNYRSCADCHKTETDTCSKFNNPISNVFEFLFKSDRHACIAKIKEDGYENFSIDMAKNKLQTIRKKKSQ